MSTGCFAIIVGAAAAEWFATKNAAVIRNAAWRGRDDIAVGNVVGSNIFNVLGIGGATSLIHSLSVPSEIVLRDNWWMLGASLLLFPLMKSGMRINRAEGGVLFLGFIGYMIVLLRAAEHA